ncbi:hypothetical protein AHF37_06060 [Paragonimus kellicotti]|nr:hypothetical protein AHF37_06060 [Paragonimus kellicotti]
MFLGLHFPLTESKRAFKKAVSAVAVIEQGEVDKRRYLILKEVAKNKENIANNSKSVISQSTQTLTSRLMSTTPSKLKTSKATAAQRSPQVNCVDVQKVSFARKSYSTYTSNEPRRWWLACSECRHADMARLLGLNSKLVNWSVSSIRIHLLLPLSLRVTHYQLPSQPSGWGKFVVCLLLCFWLLSAWTTSRNPIRSSTFPSSVCISYGIKPAACAHQWTALHYAAKVSNTQCMRFLLKQYNANVDARSRVSVNNLFGQCLLVHTSLLSLNFVQFAVTESSQAYMHILSKVQARVRVRLMH